jgi:hypothetical protein
MDEGKTTLNSNNFQPLHPRLVGLQTLLRDGRLVSGSLPTRSEQNAQADFTHKREAQQRNKTASVEPDQAGRFSCRKEAA